MKSQNNPKIPLLTPAFIDNKNKVPSHPILLHLFFVIGK